MPTCIKHMISDGTIVDGPTNGPGQHCVEYGTVAYKKGGKIKNPHFKGKKKASARDYSSGGKYNKGGVLKYSPGGMLVGPSHEEGGIPAIVDGTEPIEVEGGEFVINKQTVDAVGEDFLHKLNSTETEHHTGGYDEGQLPLPSQFKDGGKINENRRNTMRRGGKPMRRTRPVARGRGRAMVRGGAARGRKMPGGGRTCGGMNQPPCSGGGYRRGGRAGVRRMQSGGGMYSSPNTGCTMLTSAIDCQNNPGCTWNPDGPSCH